MEFSIKQILLNKVKMKFTFTDNILNLLFTMYIQYNPFLGHAEFFLSATYSACATQLCILKYSHFL